MRERIRETEGSGRERERESGRLREEEGGRVCLCVGNRERKSEEWRRKEVELA